LLAGSLLKNFLCNALPVCKPAGMDCEEKDSPKQTIKDMHSYEIPEIIAITIGAGSQHFLDWIEQETQQV